MGTLKGLMCAFRGHEAYLHFGTNRISLQCVACGFESPGWTIDRPSSIGHRLSSTVDRPTSAIGEPRTADVHHPSSMAA